MSNIDQSKRDSTNCLFALTPEITKSWWIVLKWVVKGWGTAISIDIKKIY